MKIKFTSLILILIVSFGFQFITKPTTSPNIVLIYIDDLGFGDLGHTGATGYTTPNFDQLAAKGMFFSNFYSPQAVCSASRVGLLTGCYPNRVGFSGAYDHTAKVGINSNEETIAEFLKAKGYATAAFGKWHLGHLTQFLPTNHGFDTYFGIPYSNDMWNNNPRRSTYFPPLPLIQDTTTIATNPDQSEFTTIFTEKTIEFIKKNKAKPFFTYLAHPMPHVPLFVSNKFKGKSQQGLFGDVIMELDWSIGQIRQTLKQLNIEKNTLIIVTSDNGPWLNYGNHAGSTGGFREGKGTSFEGGQRVPCIMAWPGVVPAGKVCNNLASAIDIYPTLMALTGGGQAKNKIDGINIESLLKGQFQNNPREVFYYYYRKNNLEAIRYQNWKLVFEHPGRTYEGFLPGNDGQAGPVNENYPHSAALFDLRRDPGERYNVMEQNPDIVAKINQLAAQARADLGDDLQSQPGTNRREIGKAL